MSCDAFAERLDKYKLDCNVIKVIYSCLSQPDFKRDVRGEWLFDGCRASFWVMKVSWDYIEVMIRQHNEYNNNNSNNQIACFEMVKDGELAKCISEKELLGFLGFFEMGSYVGHTHTNLQCVNFLHCG